jgi:hypothetical protein
MSDILNTLNEPLSMSMFAKPSNMLTELLEQREQAAREIERLRAELATARAALEPFAELAKIFDHVGCNRPKLDSDMIASWADHRVNGGEDIGFTVGQLRAARATLKAKGAKE